ncbi:MAG: helix-turn-helix domain-containing protein [Rhizobium sp.]|uniref:helix-turn-helix domain-containing protein n=1 Tax=Rhizobium sp. TaxID=391 RepID=UPI00389B1654
MIVSAMEFTSAAEMRSHAAAVHARLLKPIARPVAMAKPAPQVPTVEPIRRFFAKQLPAWESGLLTFDAHVVAYRVALSISSFSISGSVRSEGWSAPKVRRSIDAIVIEVLENFPGVNIDNIQSHRRTRDIIPARQESMFEVYMQRPDLSLPMIGRWFRRDHTTVLHAVKKVKAKRGIA